MDENEAVAIHEETPAVMITDLAAEPSPSPQGNITQTLLRKCSKCPKVFDNHRKLSSHVYHVHGRLFYQCTLCKNVQRKPGRLRHHIIKKHHVLPNSTAKYIKRFHEYDNKVVRPTVEPQNKNTNENPSVANSRKKTLYFKKRTLGFMKCFNCYDCSLSFTNVRELFQHVRIHKEWKYDED